VTQWGASMVADIAGKAGFRGEELHDAVALALAASQGCDHYAHNPISAPGAERRGLWAIRVDEVPAGELPDLFNPSVSAAVARALWQLSGKSFGWHPAWISGEAMRVRPVVVLHLSGKGRRNGPLSGKSFGTQLQGMVNHAEALARSVGPGIVPNE
jgi:Lysozyme like domain